MTDAGKSPGQGRGWVGIDVWSEGESALLGRRAGAGDGKSVSLVLDVGRDLAQLAFVLASVVSTEQQLPAAGQLDA